MSIDEIITRITEAETTGDAYAIARTVPRGMIIDVADQLHIDPFGHGTEWIRWAVIKEARA